MDHGTRDKSARLILASVPVQALLMAGVLALALGGRSAAPAPDGAYFVKPMPVQGSTLCHADMRTSPGQDTPVTIFAGQGVRVSPADGKVLAIGAANCPPGPAYMKGAVTQPLFKPVSPAPPAKP